MLTIPDHPRRQTLSDTKPHDIFLDAGTPEADALFSDAARLSGYVRDILDDNSAQDILEIDIRGKSSVADYMVVASGRSNRHVGALSDYVLRGLKQAGFKDIGTEGQDGQDWVLIDAGDVILHIFRPEVRVFYNLEKIWSVPLPDGLRGVAEQSPNDAEA
ncbi:MAG: ribosome silencing factor [Litorimonas sp.]